MKKTKMLRILNAALAVILCAMFAFSIMDTQEMRQTTNFSQENMLTHIERLSENGPRSLFDKESNEKAVEYIVSEIENYGFVNEDTMSCPAYQLQSYVASDETNRYQNFYLENVVVHIPANASDKTNEALMFMGHFDSVPMGQGASDDGVAVAAMLEAIRYYTEKMENGFTIRNDLVFCFVNGEEFNLFGSRAFMNEFIGFDNIVNRIKFGTNLESRGTSGTLIMFETAQDNLETVKLFSEINKTVFTCSIATMVYDTMPNSTDFSNFKEMYQGLNLANIGGGENYHTQNDSPENVGKTYLSQQAQIVEAIIEKLGSYELDRLYDADESALFFSYLNIKTVVYNHLNSYLMGVGAILLVALNVICSKNRKNLSKTVRGVFSVVIGLVLTALVTYGCYYLFQYIAVLFKVIDREMIGTITYSNIAIVIGIGFVALACSIFTAAFSEKVFKITQRDMMRAFSYIHAFLGIVLSFALPDAGYLFVFSGILLMINELLITLSKRNFASCHFEILVIALYLPIVIPVVFLATSALGLTMAYVYGLVFALVIFPVGLWLKPVCGNIALCRLINRKSKCCPVKGATTVLLVGFILFLAVSLIAPDASKNLQGKQNIAKLPFDDALVYVKNADGSYEYRIYDLNARRALNAYAPEMEYDNDHYEGTGAHKEIAENVLTVLEDGALTVKKNTEASLVYLTFKNITASSFTVDDGKTVATYSLEDKDSHTIVLHTDCTVTVQNGMADAEYKEVIRDHAALIPESYKDDESKLHFNLWLMNSYTLGK